jgi:hypothetical protein
MAFASQIRAGLKRSILNSLARQAVPVGPPDNPPQGVSLLIVLNAYQDALVAGVKSGRVVEATASTGRSVKFRTPVLGEHFRQEDVCELSQEYLEIYADAVTALNTQGIPNPTDAQILTQMLADDRLQSVTSTRRDYTLVNYPTRF